MLSLEKEVKALGEKLDTSGNSLSKLGQDINTKATRINKLNNQSQKIVKDLDNYGDGIGVTGVDINAKGNINNEGIIEADKVAIEAANKINNIAGLVNAAVSAKIKAKDVTNYGGTINSGYNTKIEADKITNQSATKTYVTTDTLFNFNSTQISSLGKIVAGNKLKITADTFNNKGAYVISGGDANIEATNINLTGIKLEDNYEQYNSERILFPLRSKSHLQRGSLKDKVSNSNFVESVLDIKGNLNLRSNNNINLAGSTINTKGNASIVANSISAIEAYNTNIEDIYTETVDKNLLISKTTKENIHKEDYTINKSGITLKGKTNLISSNDINLAASNIEGSEVDLYAGSKLDDKGNVVSS